MLLAGIGIGAVHVGGHRVRHHLAPRVVLGPFRDRVREALADHALERLAIPGLRWLRSRSWCSSSRPFVFPPGGGEPLPAWRCALYAPGPTHCPVKTQVSGLGRAFFSGS